MPVADGSKHCSRCNRLRPIEEFSRHGKGGYHHRVRACRSDKPWSVLRHCKISAPQAKGEAALRHRKLSGSKTRGEVYRHFGGRCACCGETRIEFLAVDHVNNDGWKHRIEMGHVDIAFHLKKNDFRSEYSLQLLCHNCNMAKAFYGRCPHADGGAMGYG